MSENDKNQLQIYCQRNGLALPEYSQIRDAVTGKWSSSVKFSHDGIEVSFGGEATDKKSAADIAAARHAIAALSLDSTVCDAAAAVHKSSNSLREYYESIVDTDVYVLIDYENVNKLTNLHHNYTKPSGDAQICKFLGYNHHMVDAHDSSHIVHSCGSDAVDHAISMFVGMIIAKFGWNPKTGYKSIIILTKDQFAERLYNISKLDSGQNIYIRHLPSELLCIGFLESHGYVCSEKRVKYI